MGTTERSYSDEYKSLLISNPDLVNYVEIIDRLLLAREQRSHLKKTNGYGPLEGSIEVDLIQIHGPTQTGKTLAILEMATQPTDLIILKDLASIERFRERQRSDSAALIAPPRLTIWQEMRCNPETILRKRMYGNLANIGEPAFVPDRIFVDDSFYFFANNADARSIFRWAKARYDGSPAIIAL